MGMGNTLMEIALTGPDTRLLCYVPIHEPLLFVLSIALIPLLCCVYNIHIYIQCKCVYILCKLYSNATTVLCVYSASYTVHATTVLCVYTVQVIQYMPLLCCVYIQCKLYSTCHYCVVCIYCASYTVHATTVLCVYSASYTVHATTACVVCIYSASYTVHATTVLCVYTVQVIQYMPLLCCVYIQCKVYSTYIIYTIPTGASTSQPLHIHAHSCTPLLLAQRDQP